MSTSTRSLSQLADLRSSSTRRLALSLGSAVTLSLALLLSAAPAGAVVETVESTTAGLQPRSTELRGGGIEPETFANAGGGPVVASSKTYAIYWDPTYHYHNDWAGVIDTFLQGMGGGSSSSASVFAVDAQYTDAANHHALYSSTFMGASTDTDPYPKTGNCADPHPLEGESSPKREPDAITCLTNAQIQHELEVFIADHGLQKGMGTIFYLLTPPGVTVCLDKGGPEGHCSDFSGSGSAVLTYEEERRSYPERLTKYEKENESYPERLKKYQENKTKDEANKPPIADTETEPTKPVKPIFPTEPPGYLDYGKSFCSYHSEMGPNDVTGGESTVLYGVIPWTAGGLADGHLGSVDQTPAYDCQDGGFDPTSKPIEQREKAKERTTKEESEFTEKTVEEKQKILKARELEGPHQQEPNQVPCPSSDGYCDVGLADLIVNQIAVEQQNIVTDPLLNAWRDTTGHEATDECRNFFAPAPGGTVTANEETGAGTLSNQTLGGNAYYLNDAFNLAAVKLSYPGISCLTGIRLEPKFTAPNPVNSSEIVGFNGMESDITLDWGTNFTASGATPTYASYKWNFGDGSPEITGFAPGAPPLNSPVVGPCAAPWLEPCAASPFHSYQYGGTYNVTLTVTDTAGNSASVSKPITVIGPTPPAPPAPPAPPTPPPGGGSAGAGSAAAGAGGSASAGAGAAAKTLPGPVATQAVLSHSLPSTLSKGLVVRYSVNEQVAGQFQVLLASSVANRIGLHGALAVGLPAGSPPSIVIAKAILVTTKGGRSTVKILFGKKTAAKLHKLRKVTLMLRLTVRNASSHSPLITTVLTPVNLSR